MKLIHIIDEVCVEDCKALNNISLTVENSAQKNTDHALVRDGLDQSIVMMMISDGEKDNGMDSSIRRWSTWDDLIGVHGDFEEKNEARTLASLWR
jgi:hypothetical protein